MNIGVDLVELNRFSSKNENFFKRFMHEKELAKFSQLNSKNQKIVYAASIWGIKEAMFKADNNYAKFAEFYIQRDENDQFWVHPNFDITISHTGRLLVAIVSKKNK